MMYPNKIPKLLIPDTIQGKKHICMNKMTSTLRNFISFFFLLKFVFPFHLPHRISSCKTLLYLKIFYRCHFILQGKILPSGLSYYYYYYYIVYQKQHKYIVNFKHKKKKIGNSFVNEMDEDFYFISCFVDEYYLLL